MFLSSCLEVNDGTSRNAASDGSVQNWEIGSFHDLFLINLQF